MSLFEGIKGIYKSTMEAWAGQSLLGLVMAILSLTLLASLVLSFIAVLGFTECLPLIDKGNLNLLPGISISCGGVIAILAFNKDRHHQKNDRVRKSDEIYLNIARDSFDEVFVLLKDKNNDRVTWIRASRLLLQALALKNKIGTKDIIEAFEVSEERLRAELYHTFSTINKEGKELGGLPPQFFYGIKDWETEKDLDVAAKKASAKPTVGLLSINENIPFSVQTDLAVNSVIAIFDFLKFPASYVDPLSQVKDWDLGYSPSFGVDQGAKRYFTHKETHRVVGGKLLTRDKEGKFHEK